MANRSSIQTEQILRDLQKKIVILTGPRQVGKTTLSKNLLKDYEYLNYDSHGDRTKIIKSDWNRNKELVVLDEVHKKKNWKSWLKGIYDTEKRPPYLLVTGSAKIDIVKKMGDSLAGRYFQHRLHPFDLKELKGQYKSEDIFHRLLTLGGFPEPFLSNSEEEAARWRKTHLDIILRQDLTDLESVRNIHGIETLILLLRERVGSGISYASLARDLEVDPKTVKNWIRILEELYIIFTITPYSAKLTRSLLKEPKIYFYDNGQVVGDEGTKFENLVAGALLKELHSLEDLKGKSTALHYLKTKEGKEVDFLVTIERKPVLMLEVKWSDGNLSGNLSHFKDFFRSKKINPDIQAIQLVAKNIEERKNALGIEIKNAIPWLENLKFGHSLRIS